MTKERCDWVGDHQLFVNYHDTEYGFEVIEDDVIFERLMLEAYQAGLTWRLILEKRKGFNKAFHNFDIEKVSKMTDDDLDKLRDNPEIVRNKLKIYATRNNARILLQQKEKYGSVLKYLQTLPYKVKSDPKIDLKDAVKLMKKDGIKFVGPLILEEFFMSIGMNKVKHQKHCFLA